MRSGGWFYQIVRSRKQDHRISIAVGTSDRQGQLVDERLSVEAFCCDGGLPHERLRPEALNRIVSAQAGLLQIEAITRPTRIHRPMDDSLHSRLLAFAKGHSEGWLNADRLKDGLRHV